MQHYEAIVLGAAGGVGSAALFHLAGRGVKALGLDRFSPGHNRGSSHGRTRIIRQAYFEHADYVPMLLEAYRLWAELGQLRSRTLMREIGLLQVGSPTGAVVQGVLASARQHNLPVEQLSAEEVRQRWPGFHVPREMVGVYERRAGYLEVEQCVIAHAEEAVRRGAQLRTGETVIGWSPVQEGFAVKTDRGEYHAPRLVITAGPWANDLLGDLGLKLVVRRKPQYWFRPQTDAYRAANGYPAYLYELPEGVFYGLPAIDEVGVKVAEHSGGVLVNDPLALHQAVDPADFARVRRFAQSYLPELEAELADHDPCLYTLSPDEHFVVDRHPRHAGVVFAAGLSGHGFKFTGVIGKLLAEMLLDGRTSLPCEFLSLNRPGLRKHFLHAKPKVIPCNEETS
jgi:sarcosine oxidase